MTDQLNLSLGSTYSVGLWDLHKHIAKQKRHLEGVIIVRVTAPIVSNEIEVAILAGSLYLIGVRRAGGQWLEFANDAGLENSSYLKDAKPRLPKSRWITAGAGFALSSYRALRLGKMIEHAASKEEDLGYQGDPGQLIGFFASWSGNLETDQERLRVCVLIMLVCEAMRFRSIERACANWISRRGPDAGSMRIVITQQMFDTVQNWRARTIVGDSDVTMARPEFPDPLIC